jgi:aminopeptidase S
VLAACSTRAVPSQPPTPFVAPSPAAAPATASATPAVRPTPTLGPTPLTAENLRAAIDVAAIRVHLDELQRIADANGGNRTTGSDGFAASVAYVTARLEAAGYRVDRQEFAYDGGIGANLLAELPGTDPSRVVMLGAHLDSVPNGPGINDNGSGVAAVLAIAEAVRLLGPPAATLRFAFWDAEEIGRRGSSAYVAALSGGDLAQIDAYLNLDIVGSPNFVRFVYSEPNAARGSGAISDLFRAHFVAEGLAWKPIDLTGKTDHAPFTEAGVPTSGLFSGGTEPKTGAEAAAFGGTAGVPADPCIHQACDRIGSVNEGVLGEMADAAAHVLAMLATVPGSR